MGKPSRTYVLIEKQLGQNLRTWVRVRYINRRLSWQDVSRELHDAIGATVTPETLRLWFPEYKRGARSNGDAA